MQRFILASSSPRRRELLERIGLKFEVFPSGAEERIERGVAPGLLVQEISMLKAAWVAARLEAGCLVLGADTVVAADGDILGKPAGRQEAIEMLSRLSGRVHEVYTGICVIDTCDGKSSAACEVTKVKFRKLTPEEIELYVDSGEPLDKAGAYGIQGKGALLVERIDGDFFNVVGLPLNKLYRILREEFDIQLL